MRLTPYSPRPIRFLELWEWQGWRLKVYGGAYGCAVPRPALVEAAKRAATEVLPRPAEADDRYGVGFACAHEGRGACFAFVDWWADENELHHKMLTAPEDAPAALRPAGPDALMGCVWDLAVMAFERDAWLRAVLANPHGPDLDAYLAVRLDAVI